MVPEELRYTQDHEWVSPSDPGSVRVGITDYAQSQLGDVVHVQLPPLGESVQPGNPIGEVESTKSVSDVFAPVAGEVVVCNPALADNPELVNSDPYGEGWMMDIRLADAAALDSLMTAEDYRRLTEQA